MGREYQETDLSRRARVVLKGMVFLGLTDGKPTGPKIPEYDPVAREKVINRNIDESGEPNPHFDAWYVYYEHVLGGPRGVRDLGDIDIANLCIRLNLSDEELDSFLREMYGQNYNPKFKFDESSRDPNESLGSVVTARMLYEKGCKDFGLQPRDDFPDWGDWGVALERTRNWNKKVLEVMGSGERPTRAQLQDLLENT